MSNPVIEAAVQALAVDDFEDVTTPAEEFRRVAHRVLAAVTPLIRAQVLEEAAVAAETRDLGDNSAQDGLAQEIAVAIRALAGRPADPT